MTQFAPSLEDLPERLAQWLQTASRHPSRQGLSPAMSYGRHSGPPRADSREAAVLVLLYPRRGQWHLPLTRRQAYLTKHGGQISLPGGSLDPGETPAQAALRETDEELGVAPGDLTLIGALSPVYVFNSNFLIRPWVAATRQELPFRPNPDEVAELIEMPLQVLLQAENDPPILIRRGKLEFSAPCICWHGTQIWGATHVVLGELRRILKAGIAMPAGGTT